MSTRSALAYLVAKDKTDGWKGVYCHWDGYPTVRGKEIWDVLHTKFIGNKGKVGVQNKGDKKKAIQAFIDIYITGHKGGYSSFPDNCYCHDPEFVMRDGVRDERLTSDNPDPLFIEWVYVIDPKRAKMRIFGHDSNPKEKGGTVKGGAPTLLKNGYWDYGHCQYKHKLVVEIDLLGKEPDWEAIQKKGGE